MTSAVCLPALVLIRCSELALERILAPLIVNMYALKPNKEDDENRWYCHCCLQSNTNLVDICKTCGRHESYAQEGYQLPLHGQGGRIFRPSQIIHVLADVNETDEVMWLSLIHI